jgi:hypothetical protein
VCRSKHVELLKNFEIINSITKLHLVGISTEISRCYTVVGKCPMGVNVVMLKCSVKWVWSKTFIYNELAHCANGKFITNTAYNRNKGSMKYREFVFKLRKYEKRKMV